MDPTRFDALTKALGHARSRRGLLAALGGGLLGALARGGGARAADREACQADYRACRQRANAAAAVAADACLAGPPEALPACDERGVAAWHQAIDRCQAAFEQCLPPCGPPGLLCHPRRPYECCSGVCARPGGPLSEDLPVCG